MKYIDQINAFERWCDSNYLPPLSQLLWYKLFKLNNRAGWNQWVQIDNLRLMAEIQVRREATFIDLRDKLFDAKLIEYKKGHKGSPNRYRIIKFEKNTFTSEVNTVANTEAYPVVNTVANTEVQTADIYRLDKTKQNKATTADARESVFGTAMGYYMDKISSTPSGMMVEQLKDYVETMSADVIIHAMDKALDAGAHNWNYINTILSSWKKAGIRTMADVEREQEGRRSNGKGRDNQRGNNPGTDEDDGIDWDSIGTRL